MDTILSVLGALVGVTGLIVAYFQYRRSNKLATALMAITSSYPGDVAKIEQSCVWAWSNVRNALKEAGQIPDCAQKQELLRFINLATGDSAAAARMCSILFSQLLTFQQAQFGTRTITHPEQDVLDLCKHEERNAASRSRRLENAE
jgi:hypothetical protein